jgi:hypothetical protein
MKLMLTIELDAKDEREAQAKLDAFREAVLPSENHGVLITRATYEDVWRSGAIHRIGRLTRPPERFVEPWD